MIRSPAAISGYNDILCTVTPTDNDPHTIIDENILGGGNPPVATVVAASQADAATVVAQAIAPALSMCYGLSNRELALMFLAASTTAITTGLTGPGTWLTVYGAACGCLATCYGAPPIILEVATNIVHCNITGAPASVPEMAR